MIVEFIGCTGAGKTSLAHSLARPPARLLSDLALDRPGLRRIQRPTLCNVVQDAAAMPRVALAFPRQREFLLFTTQTIRERVSGTGAQANLVLSLVRRVGMYELAASRASREIVLADEGPLLLAFVYALSDAPYGPDELAEFAALAPLADLVVHVRAPVEVLVARAQARRDRRRQLGRRDQAALESYMRRTTEVFDVLAASPALRDRVVTIGGDS